MQHEPDYYAVLGVAPQADAVAIKSAYRSLAKQWHPDRNGEHNATAKFQQIQAAYDVLSDASKRGAYDVRVMLRAQQRASAEAARKLREAAQAAQANAELRLAALQRTYRDSLVKPQQGMPFTTLANLFAAALKLDDGGTINDAWKIQRWGLLADLFGALVPTKRAPTRRAPAPRPARRTTSTTRRRGGR